MKGKKYGKLLLDLVLLVLLALMYQKTVISMHFHETGGRVLMGLFFLHKALNWKWIRGVTAGSFRRKVKVSALWLVAVLLFFAMTAVLITGLLISKTLPTTLENGFWLRPWHYFSAALALGLSGIHLGLHWGLLKNTVWNRLPVSGRLRTGIGALLLCIVLGFGTFSLVTTSYLSWFTQPFVVSEAVHEEGHGFPQVELKMFNGDYADVEQWLRDGTVDVAFVSLPAPENTRAIPLVEDELLAILPKGHPLAAQPRIDTAKLGREPFISLPKSSDHDIHRALDKAGITPNIRFTTKDDYAVIAMVEQGLGISIVPELLVRGRGQRVELRPLEPRATRTIALALPKGTASPAVEAFAEGAVTWLKENG